MRILPAHLCSQWTSVLLLPGPHSQLPDVLECIDLRLLPPRLLLWWVLLLALHEWLRAVLQLLSLCQVRGRVLPEWVLELCGVLRSNGGLQWVCLQLLLLLLPLWLPPRRWCLFSLPEPHERLPGLPQLIFLPYL